MSYLTITNDEELANAKERLVAAALGWSQTNGECFEFIIKHVDEHSNFSINQAGRDTYELAKAIVAYKSLLTLVQP